MVDQKQGLDLGTIIQLIEGNSKELKQYVIEHDLSEEELKKLLEAEESAKNRENVVGFLKNEFDDEEGHEEKEEVEIGVLKAVNHRGEDPKLVLDIDGIQLDFNDNPLVNFAGQQFEVAHPEKDETEHLENMRKADSWLEDTSTEHKKNGKAKLKSDTDPESGEKSGLNLNTLEEEQKENKPKKEEKEKLKELLKDEYGLSEDDVEGKNLQELEELQEEMRELKTKKENVIDEFGVKEEEVQDKSLEELNELEEKLEKRKQKREDLNDRFETSENLSGLDLDELKKKEEELREKRRHKNELIDELSGYGYSKDEVEDDSIEDLQDRIEEIEEKERLLDQVGADIEKEELSEVSLEYLKKLKNQKEEREKLITELETHGVSREELESCTNQDLKNLINDLESNSENYEEVLDGTVDEAKEKIEELETPDYSRILELEKQGEDRVTLERYLEDKIKEEGESFEEIEEEAENELQFLMGAESQDEKDDVSQDESDVTEKVENLRERFQDSLNKVKKDEESGQDDKEKVIALIKKYRDLDDRTQAIKTAQVLKAYIEKQLGVNKELTYGELSERLNEYDDVPQVHEIRDFFKSIERKEYSGRVVALEMDEIVKSAEDTVEFLDQNVSG